MIILVLVQYFLDLKDIVDLVFLLLKRAYRAGKLLPYKRLILVLIAGSELQRIMRGHEHSVHLLLPFGPKLLSVDEESLLKVR